MIAYNIVPYCHSNCYSIQNMMKMIIISLKIVVKKVKNQQVLTGRIDSGNDYRVLTLSKSHPYLYRKASNLI